MAQSNEPTIEPRLIKEGYLVYPDGKVIGKTGVELKLKVGSAGYILLNT